MLQRIALAIVIGSAAYWYWQGPYQDKVNPSYAQIVEKNGKAMSECLRGKAYQRGASGSGPGEELAEEICADELDLYFEDGYWHSYKTDRQ
jgi:hypothetical protein